MPVRARDRSKYPPRVQWKMIRHKVLARAGDACEGAPGVHPDCRARNYEPHPVTGSRVVLTVAHLDHDPTHNDLANLRAMCQRCHNAYDAQYRAERRRQTRLRRGGVALSPLDFASRWLGVCERPGDAHHPAILWWIELAAGVPASASRWLERGGDEIPWCGAYVHFVAHALGLTTPHKPRSSLRARHWLTVGEDVPLDHAAPGWDIVVLARGGDAPGRWVLDAPGHVGFLAGDVTQGNMVPLIGGNQTDAVSLTEYRAGRVLGVRRLTGGRPND